MKTPEKNKRTRSIPRISTDAVITCRPFDSSGFIHSADGIMRNFSNQGVYIETNREFKSGAILIMRMLRYPSMPSSTDDGTQPRSICIAEVKWQQDLTDDNATRFGMGLRYLD